MMVFSVFIPDTDECGTLESVKAATELYTPVSGTVCEKNADVESDPALVNKYPYDKGEIYDDNDDDDDDDL